MIIEINKNKINVSKMYTSGQNNVTFEVIDFGADEVTEIMSNQTAFKLCEDDGTIVDEYTNMAFVSTTIIPEDDGIDSIVKVTFRKKTDIEIRLDALEEGQETQDGAIEELASIVGGE